MPRRGYAASRRISTAQCRVLWLGVAQHMYCARICVYTAHHPTHPYPHHIMCGYILRRHLHRPTTPTRAQYMCNIIKPACVYVKGLPCMNILCTINSVRVENIKALSILKPPMNYQQLKDQVLSNVQLQQFVYVLVTVAAVIVGLTQFVIRSWKENDMSTRLRSFILKTLAVIDKISAGLRGIVEENSGL